MAEEIHVGDVGTIFRASIKDSGASLDISAANSGTARLFIFQPPGGSLSTQTASFYADSGTSGVLDFTAPSGFLNTAGTWRVQALINLGSGGSFYTDIYRFIVYPNLS